MSLDYSEQELQELYDKYAQSYDALLEESERIICSTEYGYGGEVLHRGYYCPSPVIDIVIGRGNRGRHSKRKNEKKESDYIFYKDKDGRLVMVDTYAEFGESEKVLHNREFILYEQGRTVAPQFRFKEGSKPINIVSLTLCDYEEGRLTRYRRLYMHSQIENGAFIKEMKNRMLFAEDYSYDSSGLLERSTIGNMLPGYASEFFREFARMARNVKTIPPGYTPDLSHEFTCKFFHDEDGFLCAYQATRGNGDFDPTVYKVPKYKMRKV